MVAGAALAAVGVVAALVLLGEGSELAPAAVPVPQEAAAAHRSRMTLFHAALLPDGVACRILGTIHGPRAVRARVRPERSSIDIEAELETNGHTFSVDVAEPGEVSVVAADEAGRTAEQTVTCGPGTEVEVTLAFANDSERHAQVKGACRYLETGQPADGARVRATHEGASDASGPQIAWTALADDQGAFTARVTPGAYRIVCVKDMDESSPIEATLAPDETRALELWVEARAIVVGVVRDETSSPVAGARVVGRSAALGREARAVEGHTEPDGRFELSGLVPGAVLVEAHAEQGFAEAHAIARAALPYTEVEMMLSPAGLALRGVVVAPDGDPIGGATVEAEGVGERRREARAPIRRRVTTEVDGRFTLAGLVPGRYRVRASADEFVPASEVVDEVGTSELRLTLTRACHASVVVLPAEPRALVELTVTHEAADEGADESHRRPRRTYATGETGTPIAIDDGFGRAVVTARTQGAVVSTATRSVDLCSGPGPHEVLIVRSEKRGAVEVEVATPRGQPLAGVGVELWRRGEDSAERPLSGETDAKGHLRFEGVLPGSYAAVAGEGRPKDLEVAASAVARLSLVVDRSRGEVSGVVVSGRRAVEGASIRASCGDTGMPGGLEGAPLVARSNEAGAFSFGPEDGDVCVVRAEHPTEGASEGVILRAGALPAELELMPSASIEGRVLDLSSGAPVPRYSLTVRPTGRAGEVDARVIYVSRADGWFRVDGLAPGTLSVAVTSEQGNGHAEVTLPPGESQRGIEVRVFSEGSIIGRIIGPNGPIGAAKVYVRRVTGGPGPAKTASEQDGRFQVTVPAGDLLRLFATADGFYPWGSEPFDLSGSGGPTDLGEIALSPRAGREEKEGGIGIMFATDPQGARVVQFTDDSPSRDAGIEIGDVITAIDGRPSGQLPLVRWLVALRGPVGTPVILGIERGTRAPFSVTVVRRAIGLEDVPSDPVSP